MQYIVEWDDLSIYFCDHEFIPELAMYSISEIYRRRSFRKGYDISLRGEDEYLISKDIHVHLLHELTSFHAVLDDILDRLHPVAVSRLHGLPFLTIVEVCRYSDLGLYMHIWSTYLDFCRLRSYLRKKSYYSRVK